MVSALSRRPPPRSRSPPSARHSRDAAFYAVQMWVYFAHFDAGRRPIDVLLGRLKLDYPIGIDRALGS